MLAHGMGAAQFGQLATALAITALLVETVGIGSGDVLVRAVVQRPSDYPSYYGSALWLGALTLPVSAAAGWIVSTNILHVKIGAAPLAGLMLFEIGGARVAATAESVAVAHRDVIRASSVRLISAASRFVLALVVLQLFHVRNVNAWIWWAAGQSAVTAIGLLSSTTAAYGRPANAIKHAEVGVGLLFATNQTARSTQANLDRAFMASVVSGQVLGVYAAASRFVQLGLFPMQILNRYLYPLFFEHGHRGGLLATRHFAVKCAPLVFSVGLIGTVLVSVASFLAPSLLGAGFSSMGPIAVALSVALPFIALQSPPAEALTGAGRQGLRTAVVIAMAVAFSLGLTAGAAVGGLWGIVIAFVGGHLFTALLLWGILFRLSSSSTVSSR